MKLLDSTFLIDMTRGKKDVVPVLKSNDLFLTTQINMFEVIRGLFLRSSPEKVLAAREMFENIRVLALDDSSILRSADISAKLLLSGKKIPESDCLVAGIALSNNITTIVTRDTEHFSRIKGLKIETY